MKYRVYAMQNGSKMGKSFILPEYSITMLFLNITYVTTMAKLSHYECCLHSLNNKTNEMK